jgi:hypothetical protein
LATAIKANGSAVTTANTVPDKAICKVLRISPSYIRHWLKLLVNQSQLVFLVALTEEVDLVNWQQWTVVRFLEIDRL